MRARARILVAVAVTALLASCNTVKEGDARLDALTATAQRNLAAKPTVVPPPVEARPMHDKLGVLLPPTLHGEPLPARCEEPDGITVQVTAAQTINQIAQYIAQKTKMAVQLDPRILRDDEGEKGAAAGQAAEANANAQMLAAPANVAGFPFNGRAPVMPFMPSAAVGPAQFFPDYSGPCAPFFDHVAAQYDVAWRVLNGVLYFDKYVTRTFHVQASAAAQKLSANISSGSTAAAKGPTSGSSGQVADVSAQLDTWADVQKAMEALVPKGSKFAISKSMGTVTVLATPRAMEDIDKYFRELNAVLSTSVAVEVSAIFISTTKEDDFGLDLEGLYEAGINGISAKMAGVVPSLSQATGTASIGILTPPTGVHASHLAGSQIYLRAVSSADRLADFRTGNTVCKNGTPTPIALTTDQDIVRSITFNTVAQAGAASTSANADTINYGFALQVLPRVVSPTEVNILVTFNGTDLTSLTNYSLGSQGSLELATLDKRTLWNEMTLTSGQTLVVAGAEQERVEHSDSGFGDPSNWFLGGSKTGTITRTRLILLVTPTIVNGSGRVAAQ